MSITEAKKISCGLGLLSFDRKKDALQAALVLKEVSGRNRVLFAGGFEDAGQIAERISGISKESFEDGCVEAAAGVIDSEIIYYGFDLPDVGRDELEKLVGGQVEGLSPLPMEQVGWSWRLGSSSENQRHIEAAVVRKKSLESAVGPTETIKGVPGQAEATVMALPVAAGLVRGLRACFADFAERSAVLRLRDGECVLACAEGASLCRAWVLEISGADGWAGHLARDAMACLESSQGQVRPEVYAVCRDKGVAAAVCEGFAEMGVEANAIEPDEAKLTVLGVAEAKDVYDNVEVIGLAFGAMEKAVEFDFCRLPKKSHKQAALSGRRLVGAAAAALAAALCCVLALGWFSRKELAAVREVLSREYQGVSGSAVLERAGLRESIARQRPEMLEVLGAIGSSVPEGMLIDSFVFKKGQPVRITGRARDFEAVYGFQKKLDGRSGISQVRLWEPRVEDKDKQVLFRITFNYRHFSEGVVQ